MSPNRAKAELARSTFLRELIEASGPDAWRVKKQLSADPFLQDKRDYILFSAKARAAEEADLPVPREIDVGLLSRTRELPPTTNADMYALMVDRLDDLEDALLDDTSPREAWAKQSEERVFRRMVARELSLAARGAYTVDQESVTADENETDIRLRSPARIQAVIELKIGDRRSGRDLRDTIGAQLVNRYLNAAGAISGCLLVTVASMRKRWDHPDTGKRLNVDGLRMMLQAEAERIVEAANIELRLAVKVLDLRVPEILTSER